MGRIIALKYKTKIEQWKHFETQDIDYIEYKTKLKKRLTNLFFYFVLYFIFLIKHRLVLSGILNYYKAIYS